MLEQYVSCTSKTYLSHSQFLDRNEETGIVYIFMIMLLMKRKWFPKEQDAIRIIKCWCKRQ